MTLRLGSVGHVGRAVGLGIWHTGCQLLFQEISPASAWGILVSTEVFSLWALCFPFHCWFYSFLYLREGGGIISIIKEELTLQHTLQSAGELILAAGCELAPFCWLDGSRESLLPQPYGQTWWSVSVSLQPFLSPCFLPHSCWIWSPALTFKNVFSPFSWDLALLW